MHRRKFIGSWFRFAGALSGCLIIGCKAEHATKTFKSCEDFSQLTEEDLITRKHLGYVERSPIDESHCNNCSLWLPPNDQADCGGCQLFAGPVQDQGYCTYWAPIVDG